ncbi:MAG: IclR family transcriptional regulator [Actinomycetota bacterium]
MDRSVPAPQPSDVRELTPTGTEPGTTTGVGVLDRAVAILDAVERGHGSLRDLIDATGLSKPTASRLANALEAHGFLARDARRGYRLGPRLFALAATAQRELPWRDLARPALERLAAVTGESAQLYVRAGDERLCVEVAESDEELRTIVPVGAHLPLNAGSAGKVFLAFARNDITHLLDTAPEPPNRIGGLPWRERIERQLHLTRRRGWAESVAEREQNVASVSAPVFDGMGFLLAVASVSGPIDRLGRSPGKHYSAAVTTAAREIERAIGATDPIAPA